MTAPTSTPAAGGNSGRSARIKGGNTPGTSVLSLDAGAGPDRSVEDQMARPVRFEDPARNAAYWERVKRNASSAPPLTTDQIATLRGIFLSAAREAA